MGEYCFVQLDFRTSRVVLDFTSKVFRSYKPECRLIANPKFATIMIVILVTITMARVTP